MAEAAKPLCAFSRPFFSKRASPNLGPGVVRAHDLVKSRLHDLPTATLAAAPSGFTALNIAGAKERLQLRRLAMGLRPSVADAEPAAAAVPRVDASRVVDIERVTQIIDTREIAWERFKYHLKGGLLLNQDLIAALDIARPFVMRAFLRPSPREAYASLIGEFRIFLELANLAFTSYPHCRELLPRLTAEMEGPLAEPGSEVERAFQHRDSGAAHFFRQVKSAVDWALRVMEPVALPAMTPRPDREREGSEAWNLFLQTLHSSMSAIFHQVQAIFSWRLPAMLNLLKPGFLAACQEKEVHLAYAEFIDPFERAAQMSDFIYRSLNDCGMTAAFSIPLQAVGLSRSQPDRFYREYHPVKILQRLAGSDWQFSEPQEQAIIFSLLHLIFSLRRAFDVSHQLFWKAERLEEREDYKAAAEPKAALLSSGERFWQSFRKALKGRLPAAALQSLIPKLKESEVDELIDFLRPFVESAGREARDGYEAVVYLTDLFRVLFLPSDANIDRFKEVLGQSHAEVEQFFLVESGNGSWKVADKRALALFFSSLKEAFKEAYQHGS